MQIKNAVVLSGGGTQKKNRYNLQSVADILEDDPFVLVGEGFDIPRLDTLFLTMPISWKGTVQQCAGRLHRLLDRKDEIQVYDYVETLEKMYQWRLKSYAAIGYKAKGSLNSYDIWAARNEILIVSPFLAKRRVLSVLNYLSSVNIKVTVVTKLPDNYAEKDRMKITECIELLSQYGITVKTKDRLHQKYAIMDQRIVWYVSITLLSYGTSEESIMRIENVDIALELLGSL